MEVMISVPVVDMTGQVGGTYEFDPAELAKDINKQLLHDAVLMYQQNRRQGTVRTKTRGQVAGSTKKLFKQKGGLVTLVQVRSVRLPVVTVVTPLRRCRRTGAYRMPRKMLQAATRMALLSKFQMAKLWFSAN